ncbi:hypothetical protein BN12_1170003 [Nostocoides japonicum T1-X7]|uniref:Uncharacterized protein n=1 Tax=Nostocoides japonicum T1-X7 TaxID=1194083 RepID=A0A077LW93_9MICO|nr:hypothetical protein BN12_1170003 [Tetrasphaera japonica T1-X7]
MRAKSRWAERNRSYALGVGMAYIDIARLPLSLAGAVALSTYAAPRHSLSPAARRGAE